MQSDYPHNAALGGIRQVPDSPTPNGHAPPAASTAPGTGWTSAPNALLDIYGLLSSAERDALTYIVRRTLGFQGKHDGDAIPYNQFLHGMRSAVDGHMLDYGCGIKSSATLHKALASLEQRGLIAVTHPPRATKKALIPTATYRVVLPPPTLETKAAEEPATLENEVAAGPATLEIEAEPLQLLKRSTLETEAVHFRNQSGTALEIEASKERGKKGPKERLKESSKESSLTRAGARARESESGPLHPSEGTDPSRKAEAVQTCFSEHLVHGERIAPSAITPSEGGNVTQAPPAGPPADKTKVKSGSISLDLVEGEPVDLAAAKLFLSTVPPGPKGSGWKTAQAHVLEKWRKLLAPLLDDLGPTDYGRWVRYMVGEPWLAEDPQRINWVKEPWLGAAVTTWQNLPPEQQDVPLAVAKADRTERVRERELEKYKDPRKVGSRASDKDPVHSCLDCASKPGQPHLQGCMIVMKCDPTATVVTMEHCDTHWATPLLAAWNKQHPPEPTYAEDSTPTCCQCAVKVGYKHQFSCAYIRHAGLPMESLVTAEQNDPAHYKAVYAAQKAEQERQIQIERDKARKEQGRD